MIRINLLETAQKKKLRKRPVSAGSSLIALYILLLVVEGAMLYYWSMTKEEALRAQEQVTVQARQKLDTFKKAKSERDELAKKMEEEARQVGIFDKLSLENVGPGNVLLYLAYVLSVPPLSSHAERVAQEQVGWDTQWDPDRAWFTGISESKGGEITLTGLAIAQQDTDEVLRRIKSSVYFQGVHFVGAKEVSGDKQKPLIDFKIRTYLNYDPEAGKKNAQAEGGEEPPAKDKKKAKDKG